MSRATMGARRGRTASLISLAVALALGASPSPASATIQTGGGLAPVLRASSGTAEVRIRTSLSAPVTVVADSTVRMSVTTLPARRGRIVRIEVTGTRLPAWVTVATGREGPAGRTVLSVPIGSDADLYRFRSVVPAGAGVVRSAARTVFATTAPPTIHLRPTVPLLAAPSPSSPDPKTLVGSDDMWVSEGFRWDPCRAITYRLNFGLVPPAERAATMQTVNESIATLTRDSGLQLRPLGVTTWRPQEDSDPVVYRQSRRPADAALVIAFVSDPSAPLGEAAFGRPAGQPATRLYQLFEADVRLSLKLLRGGDGLLIQTEVRGTVLHELGHVVGLDHAEAGSGQLMEAVSDLAASVTPEYQRGDRAGLLARGSRAGCWSGPTPNNAG